MDLEPDVKKNWLNELENFISHWEEETKTIKDQTLDPEECYRISDVFHKDSDGLLVRRPIEISDDEIYTRLEKLDGQLNSALAMSCTSSELKSTKRF